MKKVINQKMNNTATAEMLLTRWNGLANDDYQYLEETLYRKRSGELFLLGRGGPLSEYGVSYSDGVSCAIRIIPLSNAEAMDWVEEYFDGDAYISVFGDVEE